MASVTSAVAVPIEKSQDLTNGRDNPPSAAENAIRLGSHVDPTVFPAPTLQSSIEMGSCEKPGSTPPDYPAVSVAGVAVASVAGKESFPALAKTTKPIPPSVFSYRFASPTKNQTPYYISSDIVLSGGIAQQTRRRIVHNEVERRRKDKINGWIFKLAEQLPGCQQGKLSKNLILEKAYEYLGKVNDQVRQAESLQMRNGQLVQESMSLRIQLESTIRQNGELRQLLKKHSIALPKALETFPVINGSHASDSSTQTDQCAGFSTHDVGTTTVGAVVSMETESTSSPMPQVLNSYSLINAGGADKNGSVSAAMSTASRGIGAISESSVSQKDVPRPLAGFAQSHHNNVQVYQTQVGGSVAVLQAKQKADARRKPQTQQGQETVSGNDQVCSSSNLQQQQEQLLQQQQQQQQQLHHQKQLQLHQSMPKDRTGIQGSFYSPIQQQSVTTTNTMVRVVQEQRGTANGSTAVVQGNFQSPQQQNTANAHVIVQGGCPTTQQQSQQLQQQQQQQQQQHQQQQHQQQQQQQQQSLNANVMVPVLCNSSQSQQQTATNGNVLVQPAFQTPQLQHQNTVNTNAASQTCFQAPQTPQMGQPNQPNGNFSFHSVASIMNGNPQPPLSGVLTVPSGLVSVPQTVVANSLGTSQAQNAVAAAVVVTPVAHVGTQGSTSTVLIQQPVLQQQVPSFVYVNAAPQTLTGFTVSTGNSLPIVNQKVTYPKSKTKLNKAKRKNPNPASVGNGGNKGSSQGPHSTGQKRKDSVSSTKLPAEPAAKKTIGEKSGTSTDICRHEEILNIQNFSVSSLIPSIDAQSAAPPRSGTNLSPASNTSMPTQALHQSDLSRLPYSIESLTGGSRDSQYQQQQQQQGQVHSVQQQSLLQRQQPRQPQQQQPQQQNNQQLNYQQLQPHQPQQQQQQQQQQMQYQHLQGQQQQQHERQKQQQQQQAQSQNPTPALSFSAESLLAPSDDLLPNIQHITPSVSETAGAAQSNFPVAVASAYHESPSESTTHNLSSFSAEALIGDGVFTHSVLNVQDESQGEKLTATSRTTAFSDFSAESLISSSDLNSGLSYAIDNLISRPDSSFNSGTMVSVNPNLLHSVRTDLVQEQTESPLHSLGGLPVLVEPKDSLPPASHSSGRSVVGAVGQQGCPQAGLFPFSRSQAVAPRHYKDTQSLAAPLPTVSNCVTSSAGFLKHSVDSITSSLYGPVTVGGSFSTASSTAPTFHGNGLTVESVPTSQFVFPLGNSFSPPKSLYHGSIMGAGFV